MSTDQPPFLDRPAARWLAVLVILLCAGLLAFVHREDWRAVDPQDVAGGSADPAAACIEQRFADIDTMVDEGMADGERAALFKQRAEAMCRAAIGDGRHPLPLSVD